MTYKKRPLCTTRVSLCRRCRLSVAFMFSRTTVFLRTVTKERENVVFTDAHHYSCHKRTLYKPFFMVEHTEECLQLAHGVVVCQIQFSALNSHPSYFQEKFWIGPYAYSFCKICSSFVAVKKWLNKFLQKKASTRLEYFKSFVTVNSKLS